jgi:hypothetical protein
VDDGVMEISSDLAPKPGGSYSVTLLLIGFACFFCERTSEDISSIKRKAKQFLSEKKKQHDEAALILVFFALYE